MSPRAAKKSKKPATGKAVDKPVGKLVPARNGGSIWRGAPANPVAGTGRPPDEVRARMRELGATKGLPFLSELLDGKITLSLLGKCDECAHEQPISEEWVELLMDRIKTSTDHRLKASEQAFKYGLQSKELVIASDNAAAFFDCISKAAVELFGETASDTLKARAVALMDGKA